MPNVELLKRTLQHIEDHPESWDQTAWVTPEDFRTDDGCGTAYCFAGWAVELSGVTPTSGASLPLAALSTDVQERLNPWMIWGDGAEKRTNIESAAAALLDIDRWNGDDPHLFDGNNTLNDLRRFVAELCGDTAPAGA
jgi:hypothetical protein